jgi:hypothetical protein
LTIRAAEKEHKNRSELADIAALDIRIKSGPLMRLRFFDANF